jgi:hypothetical protein
MIIPANKPLTTSAHERIECEPKTETAVPGQRFPLISSTSFAIFS